MRTQVELLSQILSPEEKEWEARLFVDEAIKSSVEFELQKIAKALSGGCYFLIEESDVGFEDMCYIKGDDKNYHKVTERRKFCISMKTSDSGWIFYADNRIGLWLKVIDFWAGKQTIFPCASTSWQKVVKSNNQ